MAAQSYYNSANNFDTPQQQHAYPANTDPPPQYQPSPLSQGYVQNGQQDSPSLQHSNRPGWLNQEQKSDCPVPVPYQQPGGAPQAHWQGPQSQQTSSPYPPMQNSPYTNQQTFPRQPQGRPQRQHSDRPSAQQVRFDDEVYSDDDSPPPAHLRHERSYSEPPHRHHRHHRHHSRHRSPSPYYSSDSRSPSRERERPRNRAVDIARGKGNKKRNHSSTGAFLGSFGGGVIGDAIFPGLGTLGGAILGGYGGYEAGKGKPRHTRRGRDRGDSGGSERSMGSGRRDRYRDTYEQEYQEGRRRRGEID